MKEVEKEKQIVYVQPSPAPASGLNLLVNFVGILMLVGAIVQM